MFVCSLRVGLSNTSNPREMFDSIEDEQQFEIVLTALNTSSEHDVDAALAKETTLNQTARVSLELNDKAVSIKDTPPNETVKVCDVYSRNYFDGLFCCK